MDGKGHLLETSQGESGCQTEVEGTGATMQGAVDVPRLDTLTMTELACGGEMTLLALKGESGLVREPGKPCGRIGDQRQHTHAQEK
jgi:hypothetical protein